MRWEFESLQGLYEYHAKGTCVIGLPSIKRCSCCQYYLTVPESFSIKYKNRTGLSRWSSYCKECNKVYLRLHYRQHKRAYVLKSRYTKAMARQRKAAAVAVEEWIAS